MPKSLKMTIENKKSRVLEDYFNAPEKSLSNGHLYESQPRFGRGELPIEYIPLSEHVLTRYDRFGPLSFRISPTSHEHHLEYLNKCSKTNLSCETQRLFPMEFWPLPRVLSQWRFGRLNEVISVRGKRTVYNRPRVMDCLVGETVVRSLFKRNGLCFAAFTSTTRDSSDKICMVSEDILLLVNSCNPKALRELILKSRIGQASTMVDNTSVLCTWNLTMRFPWPTDKWRNNIHTDVYARSLGYECALVEGPGIVDVGLSLNMSFHKDLSSPLHVSWKYTAPLYVGLPVALISGRSDNTDEREYILCQSPTTYKKECPILLIMEVKEL